MSQFKICKVPIEYKDTNKTLRDTAMQLMPNLDDWTLRRELNLIGLGEEYLERSLISLSGGEKTKFGLAMMFLDDEKFALIDEPTDSLDSQGRCRVAEYLQQKTGFVLVSHDRYFLDLCVNYILAINKHSIELQAGNFSQWNTNKQQKDKFENAQNKKLRKEIVALKQAAEQKVTWSHQAEKAKKGAADRGFMGAKAARQMKTAKILESRLDCAIEKKQDLLKDVERVDELKINCLDHNCDLLLKCSNLNLKFGSREIFCNFEISIRNADRILVCGRNGAGKSTLLKVLSGKLKSNCTLEKASQLQISYLPQELPDLECNIVQFAKDNVVDVTLFFTILTKLGLQKQDFDTKISNLSLGQKKKVYLAKSLCYQAHLYIWDEPLNYLDMESRIQLENLILQHKPTLIFVEHDHMFCKNIATNTIVLVNQPIEVCTLNCNYKANGRYK